MPVCLRFLFVVLFAGLTVVPAQARLGEAQADIMKRFGKPEAQPRKDTVFWLFEAGDSGQLLYTVTFNAKGLSIAEGLKPVKRASFTSKTAMDFIETQLVPNRDSKTQRIVPHGEKYRFAGQNFVCAANEYVVLDEPRGLLLIWTQVVDPAVLVVGPEMFLPAE